MMRMPTAMLEGKKIQRIIFSIRPPAPLNDQEVLSVMRKCHGMGVWCFDLPSMKHLSSFRELKRLAGDDTLTGICHLEAEQGVSFLGRPFHQFESRVVATIRKNLFLPASIRNLPSSSSSAEVFTQREIDRITFDPLRLEKSLSLFDPEESPFLLTGEKYSDWLLGLGRIDLLKETVQRVREKGFIPIFSGQWATFVLPKAKPLNAAAYAVPINEKWSFFDWAQACDLVKKFDKPVISLNPLADGKLLKKPEEAFSFLFNELKIHSAIAEIATEKEAATILDLEEKIPSLTPRKKA
jgi:hypothetical protein